MAISTGAAILGGAALSGVMGMSASKSAADAQAAAAGDSNALQKYMYDQNRADQLPFLNNGTAASNQLAYLLGLRTSPANSTSSLAGASLVDSVGGVPGYNADLYNNNAAYRKAWDDVASEHYAAYGRNYIDSSDPGWIRNRLQEILAGDIAAAEQAPQQTPMDAGYGSLLKSITREDIEADPTYSMGLEFGLNEGTKGINRQAAATGGLLSGATLKALTKYGNDYASTKANDAVNRINANKQQTYSMLSGMSGGGQAAAGQTQAAGTNYANNVGGTMQSLGNARAASSIGAANAISGGINTGLGYYQNNQLLKALTGGGSGSGGGTIDPWGGNYYQQPGYGF